MLNLILRPDVAVYRARAPSAIDDELQPNQALEEIIALRPEQHRWGYDHS